MISLEESIDLKKRYPMFEIGEGSYGLLTVMQWSASQLRIGRFCSFAAGTVALLGGEHDTRFVSTYPFSMFWGDKKEKAPQADVWIGSDVWVGATSVILGGSRIGTGAVIAAGSVVSGNVAPFSVVGGNPLRFMRWRFDEETRNALLAIGWWDWPEERLRRAAPYLQSQDVQGFIAKVHGGEL